MTEAKYKIEHNPSDRVLPYDVYELQANTIVGTKPVWRWVKLDNLQTLGEAEEYIGKMSEPQKTRYYDGNGASMMYVHELVGIDSIP